jgi:DNA repair protein RadC
MKYKIKYQEYDLQCCEGPAICTPNELHAIVKDDYSPISEEMYLLVLNIKNKVINKYLIAKGSYNIILCSPADIFTPILKADGRSFVLAHNHPSGDIKPSQEDTIFTKKINECSKLMGVSFIDHIIYTPTEYYSFKKQGIIT